MTKDDPPARRGPSPSSDEARAAARFIRLRSAHHDPVAASRQSVRMHRDSAAPRAARRELQDLIRLAQQFREWIKGHPPVIPLHARNDDTRAYGEKLPNGLNKPPPEEVCLVEPHQPRKTSRATLHRGSPIPRVVDLRRRLRVAAVRSDRGAARTRVGDGLETDARSFTRSHDRAKPPDQFRRLPREHRAADHFKSAA